MNQLSYLNKEIGKRIKETRELRNLSQKNFGEILGIDTELISDLESGSISITPEQLTKLWKEFKISPHLIITGETYRYTA